MASMENEIKTRDGEFEERLKVAKADTKLIQKKLEQQSRKTASWRDKVWRESEAMRQDIRGSRR